MVSVSKSGMSSRATVTSRRMSVPPVRMVSDGGSRSGGKDVQKMFFKFERKKF